MDEIGAAPVLNLNPAYAAMVMLGFAAMLLFRVAGHFSVGERRRYYSIQVIMLVGAVIGAKFAVLMGDALWPIRPFHQWNALLYSGRSIVGALLFGFLVAEMAKKWLRYPLPPNDRFAVALPFSIGIGRLGCYFSGCCLGLPNDHPFSFVYGDGIARHPIALYEMTFHFISGILLLQLYKRGMLFGRLFAVYLVGYGAFRFATEWLRVTEKAFNGLSAYQWFALAMIMAGVVAIAFRSRRQPNHWQHYRREAMQ